MIMDTAAAMTVAMMSVAGAMIAVLAAAMYDPEPTPYMDGHY